MTLSQAAPPPQCPAATDRPGADRPGPAATVAAAAPSRVPALLLLLAVAGLVGALFAARTGQLLNAWSTDDTYSHGFLVPLVAAYLGWAVLRRQGLPQGGSPGGGLLWLAAGGLLHLWAAVVASPVLDFLALAALLYGLAVLLGGRRWAAGFAFPIAFLGFMFPLPTALMDRLAVGLQELVARAAAFVLQLVTPVYQEGNKLYLVGGWLEVGEACSGLRQMLVFLGMAVLLAYFSRRGLACRILLVLAAVPVAVLANLLRLLLMAGVMLTAGPEWVSERRDLLPGLSFHTAWGYLTIAAGVFLFLGARWWLERVFPAPAVEEPAADGPPPRALTLPPGLARPLGTALVLLGALLLTQQVLARHLAAAPVQPAHLRRPLADFRPSLGDWAGQDVALDDDIAGLKYFTQADDRLYRAYVSQAGPFAGLPCELWMIHRRDRADRRHHPQVCFTTSGYTEVPSGRSRLPLPGQEAPAQRFCFTRNDRRTYVYYWHYTLEPGPREGLSFLQRLHQDSSAGLRPSLTVEVFAKDQTPAQLEAVEGFVRLADEELQKCLPPGARRGSHTLTAGN